MLGYPLLVIIHLVGFASAQQYGPVPLRPQQFSGATLIQPARPNFRQRPISGSRPILEAIPSIDQAQVTTHLRRAQTPRRTKPQSGQPQTVDQQRANLVEDIPTPFIHKVAAPTPVPQFLTQTSKLTPRPVEEEVNEDEEIPTTIATTPSTTTYAVPVRSNYSPVPASAPVPAPLPQNPNSSGFQRAHIVQPSAFRPALPQQAQPVQFSPPVLQGRQIIRQQVRPTQGVQAPVNRQPILQGLLPQIPVSPQPTSEEDQYFRQVQNRPLKKQETVRQQIIEREPVRQSPRQQPTKSQVDFARPLQREPHAKDPQREKKPVAQTIRKYHEEHEDGSITWGYENDDGSFKEETIGVDCVTRGKYGYFDPDGVKREYTYQTGIPCDKAQESEEAASTQGFIDYTNNKYVLPNGDEIDLEAMVKNRARKPVSRYAIRA